jgi:hypothetical protein
MTLGPLAYRRWECGRELPSDVPGLRAALYFEQRRHRHLDQAPRTWPENTYGPYVEALLAAIRARVAAQPPLPPIFAPAEGVVRLAPYRETQYMRVSDLKRKNGVAPQVGDDDDWVTVVHGEEDAAPMVPLSALTLHPVDWVPHFTRAATLPVQVGPVRLLDNPLMTLEQWMIAMAGAAHPVEPEPLFDVELEWLDGRTFRLPVPMYYGPHGWGDNPEGWNTPGVSQCLIRYSQYFAGEERWTDWDSLGVSDWERLLARLPAAARADAAAFHSGPHEVQGGIWWQRFWRRDPTAGEDTPPDPTT